MVVRRMCPSKIPWSDWGSWLLSSLSILGLGPCHALLPLTNPGNPLAKLAWAACMQIRQPPPLHVTHRPHGLIHASQRDDTWSTKSWGIRLLAVLVFFAPVNTFWIHDAFVLIWPQLAEKHKTARSPSAYFNGWSPPILDVIRVRAPGKNKSYIFRTPIFIAPSQPSCHDLERHLHTKHEAFCEIVVFPNTAETAGGHRWFLTNDFSQWSSCSCLSGFRAGKTRCQAGAMSLLGHGKVPQARGLCTTSTAILSMVLVTLAPMPNIWRSTKNCVAKETMPLYLYHHEDKAAWRTWPHGKPKQDCAKSLGLR